jgi:hypothetical protein
MEFIFSEINIYMYRQIFLGLRCFKYFTEYEHFSVFCSIVFNGINSGVTSGAGTAYPSITP